MILWPRSVTNMQFPAGGDPVRLPNGNLLIAISEPDAWTSTCMQCGRRILADGYCGCWWRRLPSWLQAFVLTVLPVGKFQ